MEAILGSQKKLHVAGRDQNQLRFRNLQAQTNLELKTLPAIRSHKFVNLVIAVLPRTTEEARTHLLKEEMIV